MIVLGLPEAKPHYRLDRTPERDGQTDGQTDGKIDRQTDRYAVAITARKNSKIPSPGKFTCPKKKHTNIPKNPPDSHRNFSS